MYNSININQTLKSFFFLENLISVKLLSFKLKIILFIVIEMTHYHICNDLNLE